MEKVKFNFNFIYIYGSELLKKPHNKERKCEQQRERQENSFNPCWVNPSLFSNQTGQTGRELPVKWLTRRQHAQLCSSGEK